MPDTNEHTPLISNSDRGSQSFADDIFLCRFQQAVGINSTSSAQVDLESARRKARGVYKEAIGGQKWQRNSLVEAFFYLAVLTNLVIGATLASLGPLSMLHPTAITLLGIVNTTTAGILAMLRGQGMPDRLRKDEFEMRKVQDFIEETEARLAFRMTYDMTDRELDGLVKEVFDRYNVARDTAEMNRPDSYAHQVDDTPGEHGMDADSKGAARPVGVCQSSLALKGKALVIS